MTQEQMNRANMAYDLLPQYKDDAYTKAALMYILNRMEGTNVEGVFLI